MIPRLHPSPDHRPPLLVWLAGWTGLLALVGLAAWCAFRAVAA